VFLPTILLWPMLCIRPAVCIRNEILCIRPAVCRHTEAMHTADLIPKNTGRTQTSVHCCTLWLSRLTTRSAFPLSTNLTLQTLDAISQNTLQRFSQNHANFPCNLPTSYRTSSSAVAKRPRNASCELCLSVVSFNSTKCWVESFTVSYVVYRFITACS